MWFVDDLFCNELNKINDTGAQILDFIYYMTLKLVKNKSLRFCHRVPNVIMERYHGRHYVMIRNL